MPRRSPVYVRILLNSTMPIANIPENTTPIAVSSFSPDRRATAPIARADATAAIEPPITMLIFTRNAMTTPGKAAWAIASPRKASPRRTTNTPTLAHTSATRTAASSARCTNAYCSGSSRSGMVLVRDVLGSARPVSAVRAAQDRVVAKDGGVAIGDDAAVHREHAREVRHHAREIVCGDEDRTAVAREVARLNAAERRAGGVAVNGRRPASRASVRDASHQDDVLDAERVIPVHGLGLRQIGEAPRARSRRGPKHAHASLVGPQQTHDDLQQRRLAGAVRADERDKLAATNRQIDVIDDRAAVVAGTDATKLNDDRLTHGWRRYASQVRHSWRYFNAATILSTTTLIRPMYESAGLSSRLSVGRSVTTFAPVSFATVSAS